MNILVTGGAGYIGSTCSEFLIDNNHQVTIFDSLELGYQDAIDPRANFIKGDLNNKNEIFAAAHSDNFDAVMHFAAYSLVGESIDNPGKYFMNNNVAGLNLLNAAVDANIGRFVFSSTAATYGLPKESPITETAEQSPINPYGESKLFFEKMLYWYNRKYNLKYTALRYFNAAGATEKYGESHSPETHIVPLILQVALGQRDCIKVFGNDYPTPDGTCLRDYIHITDLAQAHMLALDSSQNGHYNLGTGNGFSVMEIIDVARKITGHPIPVKISDRRPGDPAILIADSKLIKKELGWDPKFENIEDIILSTWNWMQKHHHGYNK